MQKIVKMAPKQHNADSGNNIISSNNNLADTLDLALSQLLTKNRLGIQIDKEFADNALKFAYRGSTNRIGEFTSLLHNMFGSSNQQRIRQLETWLKCAQLVSFLAVTSSERLARLDIKDNQGEVVTESSDEGKPVVQTAGEYGIIYRP